MTHQNSNVFAKPLTADRTATVEKKFQNRLRELLNSEQLPKQVYDEVRPTASQKPRMYGLPKTHEVGTPLRPILSMSVLPTMNLPNG